MPCGGEIDFTESFTRRVALLKGLDVSVMKEIAENLPITEGVDRLMFVLKKYGYKIAILSGGFTYFGEYLQKKYGIDYVYANELEIENGKLTGRYVGDVVDGKRKAELLRLIAQVEKVDIAQTIAVGDGPPTTCPCWAWQAWALLSMPSPKWWPMPNNPSTPSVWTACFISSGSKTRTLTGRALELHFLFPGAKYTRISFHLPLLRNIYTSMAFSLLHFRRENTIVWKSFTIFVRGKLEIKHEVFRTTLEPTSA